MAMAKASSAGEGRSEAPVVVSVVGKEMVVPATPTRRHSYFLSCFDIMWKLTHYNQRLLFYQADGQGAGAALLQKLKSSLALCLVHYYPWCGRLSSGERLSIDCNDAGVEFVEAFVPLPISHLSSQAFQMKPFFEDLCTKVDHHGDSFYSSPLLSIQATLFLDGGLALGITQSHIVADGQALWNFMVSWGECARGLPLSVPPVLDRECLALPNPSPEKATWEFNFKIEDQGMEEEKEDVLLPKTGEGVETHSSLEGNKEALDAGNSAPTEGVSSETQASVEKPLVPCFFNLSASAVKNLKVQDGGAHTSYEVTCAHLWQRLTAARQEPAHVPTYFFVLANCRTRLKPPLPAAYFGNAIAFSMAASTAGKIRSESLHATASRIHDTVMETVNEGSLVGLMHWLELHDHNVFMEVFYKLPQGITGVNVASSPWFPVYEVDFGWGTPAAVRCPKVPGDGEMVFFGGHPNSVRGDVEICASVPGDVLRRLLEDPLFLGEAPSGLFEDT